MFKIISNEAVTGLQHRIVALESEMEMAQKLIGHIAGQQEIKEEVWNNSGMLGSALQELYLKLSEARQNEANRNRINEQMSVLLQICAGMDEDRNGTLDLFLKELVKCIGACQGAVFLVSANDEKLSMEACYAYNRKKFLQKEVNPGEGLVGQCWLEQELIRLTEIPEDYANITSGLGEAKPREVLIVPMVYRNRVAGVMELAALQAVSATDRELVMRIVERVAGLLISSANNEQTRLLLQEQQMLNEQTRSQEEEMRQQLEEMQAIQEELARKESEKQQELEDLRRKYEQHTREVLEQERRAAEQKAGMLKKLITNNVLIDVAGRNRMLSQKIAFYAEMVAKGQTEKIGALQETVNMLDLSLKAIRSGGNPPGYSSPDDRLEPAESELAHEMQPVEQLWQQYLQEVNSLIFTAKLSRKQAQTDEALRFIETHSDTLLAGFQTMVKTCLLITEKRIAQQ